jgi:hypothetical protein
MPKVHDRGGWPTQEPIERGEHELADWERRVDALHMVLGEKGVRSTDEMRRAIENLEPRLYESLSYYERWTAALESLMIEKGILTAEEIDRKMADLSSGSH